ncbi:MAG: SDR family NAD(P)-dependent oxidoreductase [Alphaproteobacteria bacterium]|nr:SDR family NAD(P)-dependent oxidoreductase [Alphaproteobacteria bacterium]
MAILVTGAAGFIGTHVCHALLARGDKVLGVDNLNDYYDVQLKHARLGQLERQAGFVFAKIDIADREAMEAFGQRYGDAIDGIIHLAAQAGVRYSVTHPYAYIEANVMGHMVMLELARHLPKLRHLVYASSSSVYGGNSKVPFAVGDPADNPVSLYAATKRADELFSQAYHHLFNIPVTGLRFFTVYGPWGRPDMAAYLFARAMLAGEPIKVFNHGKMKRDFTYIDDAVKGVLAAYDRAPQGHKIYNIGNAHAENLMDFIALMEDALGVKAKTDFQPMQPGDVAETFADIAESRRDLGFTPKTAISEGIPRFAAWYREYHKV